MLSAEELATIGANPYRADFPLLAANRELAFLDSAATEQRPRVVLEAERSFYETMNANPLRGLYRLSVEATAAVDEARRRVARLVGAVDAMGVPQADEIVFTRNASESLNLAARTLPQVVGLGPGDEVVITIMEHHSNLIPWQQACRATGATLSYLRPDEDWRITSGELAAKIRPSTKLVAVTQVSNVLGVEVDVRAVAAAAHDVGALVVVDGAQSVPHLPVDVRSLGADLLAFSAHKLGGPMGVGVLWGRHELLEAMPPFLTGGEMIETVTETDAIWAPPPAKFEAGTQDAAGIHATGAAVAYLEGIGMGEVERRERLLARQLVDRLDELDFVELVGPADGSRHVGSAAFNVRGVHPHDVASLLDARGVAIRAGHHCAQPLLAWLGQQSTCRASVALYNDTSDIDRLVDGLRYVWQVFNGS